jgi:predicted membrane-bound dolichyl-phosphate-mannose-protein mannosyltransferase
MFHIYVASVCSMFQLLHSYVAFMCFILHIFHVVRRVEGAGSDGGMARAPGMSARLDFRALAPLEKESSLFNGLAQVYMLVP